LENCITALSDENILDNKEPYITIQLSRYEYEKYLVPFNDSFFEIIFSYEDKILGFFPALEDNKILRITRKK
jgi:hypothetical protein